MYLFRMPGSSVVKNTARTVLNGKWPLAIAVSLMAPFGVLILFILNSLVSITGEIILKIGMLIFSGVFIVAVLSPLFLGIIRFFWRLADSADDELSGVFYYFSDYKKYIRALKLTLIIGWRIVTAFFLWMLPFIVISIISNNGLYQLLGREIPLWVPNLLLVESFLRTIGILCSVIYISKYYLVPVLAVMDEDKLLLEAVHSACMVSKRSGSAFLSLLASLIVWILSSFLLVPMLYTLPFIMTCYVVHCRYAIVNYNLSIEKTETESYL